MSRDNGVMLGTLAHQNRLARQCEVGEKPKHRSRVTQPFYGRKYKRREE